MKLFLMSLAVLGLLTGLTGCGGASQEQKTNTWIFNDGTDLDREFLVQNILIEGELTKEYAECLTDVTKVTSELSYAELRTIVDNHEKDHDFAPSENYIQSSFFALGTCDFLLSEEDQIFKERSRS